MLESGEEGGGAMHVGTCSYMPLVSINYIL